MLGDCFVFLIVVTIGVDSEKGLLLGHTEANAKRSGLLLMVRRLVLDYNSQTLDSIFHMINIPSVCQAASNAMGMEYS